LSIEKLTAHDEVFIAHVEIEPVIAC
jgi:hypothetical protein